MAKHCINEAGEAMALGSGVGSLVLELTHPDAAIAVAPLRPSQGGAAHQFKNDHPCEYLCAHRVGGSACDGLVQLPPNLSPITVSIASPKYNNLILSQSY